MATPKPDHLFCRVWVNEMPSFKKGKAVFSAESSKLRRGSKSTSVMYPETRNEAANQFQRDMK